MGRGPPWPPGAAQGRCSNHEAVHTLSSHGENLTVGGIRLGASSRWSGHSSLLHVSLARAGMVALSNRTKYHLTVAGALAPRPTPSPFLRRLDLLQPPLSPPPPPRPWPPRPPPRPPQPLQPLAEAGWLLWVRHLHALTRFGSPPVTPGSTPIRKLLPATFWYGLLAQDDVDTKRAVSATDAASHSWRGGGPAAGHSKSLPALPCCRSTCGRRAPCRAPCGLSQAFPSFDECCWPVPQTISCVIWPHPCRPTSGPTL